MLSNECNIISFHDICGSLMHVCVFTFEYFKLNLSTKTPCVLQLISAIFNHLSIHLHFLSIFDFLPAVYCCHVLSLNSACPENTYLVVVQSSPQYKTECVDCPENSTSERGIGKICPCIEGFGRIEGGNASSPCVGECQHVLVFHSTPSCCLYEGIHECMVYCVS